MRPPVTKAEDLKCGSVITKSITLEFSLTNCAGDGIVIGKDGITLDLDGYTIDGADGPNAAGVRNEGHKNVHIEDGTIDEFEDGVRIEGKGPLATEVKDLELHDNRNGIFVDESRDNEIHKNELISNEKGIVIEADFNTVEDNAIEGSRPGISMKGNHNTIVDNTIDLGGNGLEGSGDNNTIADNDFEKGAGAGITLTGAANIFDSNDVEDFGSVGIWLKQNDAENAKKNIVKDNDVSSTGHDGILIDSDDTTIDGNGSKRNAGDGIAVRGKNALIEDNSAHRNGGYGIKAPENARGEGNMAGGNDAGDCSPSALCE